MTARARRVLLDTSAYSWLRRGHTELVDCLASADVVYVSTTVLGELEAGFRIGSRHRENAVTLDDFLAEPFVELVPITLDVARRYGSVFAQLRRDGTPIPMNDVWIAAAALCKDAHLLTFDGHFERVAGLEHTRFA